MVDKSGVVKQKNMKDRAIHIEDISKPKYDDVYYLYPRELFDFNSTLRKLETSLRLLGLTLKRVLKNEAKIYYLVEKK